MTRPADACVLAVRSAIGDLSRGSLVLVACSGGGDSLALAAATARAAGRAEVRAGAVIVDHGLQEDSDVVAARTADICRELGLGPVLIELVTPSGGGGPEAEARRVRYTAFTSAAQSQGAAAVLLGHTEDDQAESVLLGLARGSGPRALAGMASVRGVFRRPFLELPRATVRAAFPAFAGHSDPHNSDPRYARARVRSHALPVLEEVLGPGIARALARSARQCRVESEALDEWAKRVGDAAVRLDADGAAVDATLLATYPTAVVARVMQSAAQAAGAPGGRVTSVHVAALVSLVEDWHGQGPIELPGAVSAKRDSGTVVLRRRPTAE